MNSQMAEHTVTIWMKTDERERRRGEMYEHIYIFLLNFHENMVLKFSLSSIAKSADIFLYWYECLC